MAKSKGRKPVLLPEDLEGMFRTAEEYQLGARILQVNLQLGIQVMLPNVAISALSLEILFKCLITLEGETFDGIHDLKNLFETLSEPSRARIRSGVEQIFLPQYNPRLEHVHNEFNCINKTSNPFVPIDFDWVIENIAYAFRNSRYPYEIDEESGEYVSKSTQPINWVGGELFYMITKEIILEKKPEWATPQKLPTSLIQ